MVFRGIGDLTLKQYFESEGGATSYYGTVFPGFPNMFIIVGQLHVDYGYDEVQI
jgi:hypothetical protein